jgi:hypothetical protein
MMGHKGKNYPTLAAHNGAKISKWTALAKKNSVCPYFPVVRSTIYHTKSGLMDAVQVPFPNP